MFIWVRGTLVHCYLFVWAFYILKNLILSIFAMYCMNQGIELCSSFFIWNLMEGCSNSLDSFRFCSMFCLR
jgi:hypothetical protein